MVLDFSWRQGRWARRAPGTQCQSVLSRKNEARARTACRANAANRAAAQRRGRHAKSRVREPVLPKKRRLKTHLKPRAHTGAGTAGRGGVERGLEMRERLQKRIVGVARRRAGLTQQQHTQLNRARPQTPEQVIKRLQHGRRAQRLDGGLHGGLGQKRLNQSRQELCAHAMPRQRLGEINAPRAPAPAPTGAIRAIHPVPASHAFALRAKTLAHKRAVAVERAALSAMRARPLLQRKSVASRDVPSHTKRAMVSHMPRHHNARARTSRAPKPASAKPVAPRRGALHVRARSQIGGTRRRVLGSRRGIFYQIRGGADGTHCSRAHIINQPAFATALRRKYGTSYDDNENRNS